MKQTWKKVLYSLNTSFLSVGRFTFGKPVFAIVLIALLHNLIYLPLKIRSARQAKYNRKKMQELQPALKAIQEKYRREPGQRLMATQANQHGNEIKRLYQEAGISFSPGCATVILPILTGSVVIQAITAIKDDERFKNGGILWFKDLTKPDRYYVLAATQTALSLLRYRLLPLKFYELDQTALSLWNRFLPHRYNESEKSNPQWLQKIKDFEKWSPLLTFGLILITRRQKSSSLAFYNVTSYGLELAEDYLIKKLITDSD